MTKTCGFTRTSEFGMVWRCIKEEHGTVTEKGLYGMPVTADGHYFIRVREDSMVCEKLGHLWDSRLALPYQKCLRCGVEEPKVPGDDSDVSDDTDTS